jgi:probable aminopeptidase NPEPL1
MPTSFQVLPDASAAADVDTLVIVGRQSRLLSPEVRALVTSLPPGAWDDMVKRGDPGDNGRTASSYTGGQPRKIVAGVLPDACSRHNAPSRAWAIPGLVKAAGSAARVGIVLALEDASYAFASALAVARSFPSFSATSRTSDHVVRLGFLAPGPVAVDRCRVGIEALRFASQMTDAPPNQLNTGSLVETAREVASRLPGVAVTVIQGDQLLHEGLGGLWNVGKASPHPPALVVLDYDPPGATRRIGWIGKGIVYDTGGLSIKTKTGMPGMKTDMAGAAAVLASFAAAVQLGLGARLTAALCIAENAVGPNAMRPDDVITLYSGKTVEVNNTDAEGRLVLADGLAWVARHRAPDELVDIATLTGAQRTATGKHHAALYTNDEDLERRALAAGRASGDLVHALPFAPEFFRGEFSSPVADLKNSVKDRENAQSSCAGQFLLSHLEEHARPWLHVDMAGPAVGSSGRATGFGVGLLLTLAGVGA